MANPLQNKRSTELDALRGIAALSVVLFHFTFGYDNGYAALSPDKFYFRYGYLGVNLFFIISGFVIFMTLEKTTSTRGFAMSRFSRLYPAYWTGVLLTASITTLFAPPLRDNAYTLKELLANFSMLQSFFKIRNVDSVYWTLSVELVFYFWMWLLFRIRKLAYTEWFCLAWLLAVVCLETFNIPFRKYLNIILIQKYAPLFIAGILFYRLKKNGGAWWMHLLILCSLLAACYDLEYPVKSYLEPVARPHIVPYVVIVCLYAAFYLFVNNKLAFLAVKPLLFLGNISYCLYLVHQNIGYIIIYWLKQVLDKQVFYVPVTVLLVTILAWAVHMLVEKPVMNRVRAYNKKKEAKLFAPAPGQTTLIVKKGNPTGMMEKS